jgi:hypothetical protein
VAFPQVLAMMGTKPENVQRLGDAFLADPGRLMDRAQALRKKAQDAGNLKSNEQQKISTTTESSKQIIIIEPAQPQTVYVPVYQPTVVYGTWGYPSYPPYYYPPPPYYYPPGGAFVAGVFWGAAIVGISNGLWGNTNWGGGNVNINVNKFNNVNINNKITNNDINFKHNPQRRGDVPYRDGKSRDQFGSQQRNAGAGDRQAFRGKEGREASRANANDALKSRGVDPAAGRERLQGVDRDRAMAASRDSGRVGGGNDRMGGDRMGGDRSAGGESRRMPSGASSGAFSGVQNGGASRASADRGMASRSAMNSNRGGGGGARAGGAPRGGGGVGRR